MFLARRELEMNKLVQVGIASILYGTSSTYAGPGQLFEITESGNPVSIDVRYV